MKNVYIIGSKSIGQYGGFETFVKKLVEYHKDNKEICYYIACKANGNGCMNVELLPEAKKIGKKDFVYCNAKCFMIDIPEKIGAAQAIYYDIKSLQWCCNHIIRHNVKNPVVYILASRIGPFEKKYANIIHKYGGVILQNPDGHEDWRRKWNWVIRKYWKFSEAIMVKNADLVICDSINIEKYIHDEYSKYSPKTKYIAYGSDLEKSNLNNNDEKYCSWLKKNGLKDGNFYISVGRFVPENNFEIMIREFMKSKTDKDYAVITTDNKKFLEKLDSKLGFSKDKRIKFVGTVYDGELLKKIRENAYAYFHGHEVGGTNPSLLEALGSTKVNLLLDVGFNREVAENAAIYWTKKEGSLAKVIDELDKMNEEKRDLLGEAAKKRIEECYNWQLIADLYKDTFLNSIR